MTHSKPMRMGEMNQRVFCGHPLIQQKTVILTNGIDSGRQNVMMMF